MKELSYLLMKIKYRLKGRDKEVISAYYRKEGMKIGKNCCINSNILTTENYLISLGDNVTIAGGVSLITHDNCVSKMIPDCTDLFGKITIGDNCFIGAQAVILYGVTLANNITVVSGSVVANSFDEENIIIAGNPAKKICTYESFVKRNKDKVFNLDKIPSVELRTTIENSDKLISRKNK